MSRNVVAIAALLMLAACTPGTSLGQADPYWLRSWNAAQQARPAMLTSGGRIAPPDEPGEPLHILGRVFAPDGRTPAPGVVVHAYHRDVQGFDFGPGDAALDTWRLQGWARTDEEGRFEFHTIRPAADNLGRDAAHVHFTLVSSRHGRQWAETIYFADDPKVSDQQRQRSAAAGEFGWLLPVERSGASHRIMVRLRLKATGDF